MNKSEYREIVKGRSRGNNERNGNDNLIFSLFSHIADHTAVQSSLCYIFFLFLETFHLLYLPVVALPHQNYGLEIFTDILTSINYPRILINAATSQSWMALCILWIAHAVFMLVTTAGFIVLAYFPKKGAARHSKFLSYLSSFLSMCIILMQTVLLLPMTELFVFPVLCSGGVNMLDDKTGMPSFLSCGSAGQIVVSVVGLLLELLLALLIFFSMSVLQEDYYFSPLPWAGESHEVFFLQGLAKFATYFYIAIDVNLSYMGYPLLIVLLFYGFLMYEGIRTARFMCRSSVLVTCDIQTAVVFVLHAYSSVHFLYDSSTIILTFTLIVILGAIMGIFAYIHGESRKRNILFKDRSQLKLMSSAEEHLRSLCSLTIKSRDTSFWRIVFRNVLHTHQQDCADDSCVCRRLTMQSGSGNSSRVAGLHGKFMDDALLLIEKVIEGEANRWKQSRKIMLELSYFESIVMKNYFKAYYWVKSSETMRRGKFNQQFMEYRMKHTLAQQIVMQESKSQGAELLRKLIKFQNKCTGLQKMLQHTTKTIISFWKLFESARFNVNELFSMAQKIAAMLKFVSALFKYCAELSPNYPYIYYYYGHFIRLVLNNPDEASDYIEKGADIFRQMQENRYKYEEDISQSPDTAVVIVSGSLSTLGTILYANQHVKEQLGFNIADLEGRNVSRLMPAILGEKHDEFMLRHFQTGDSYVLGHERMVFIQTKNGLIEPVCIVAKTLPSVTQGIRYVGFIRRDSAKIRNTYIKIPSQYKDKAIAFILTDDNKNIVGISKHACSLFGLTSKYIMRKKGFTTLPYPIGRLAPELDNPANEKKLQSGFQVTLNTSSLLEFLDYDYLKHQEVERVFSSVKERKSVYVVMMRMVHKGGVLALRVYAMVSMSMWPSTREVFRAVVEHSKEAKKKPQSRRSSDDTVSDTHQTSLASNAPEFFMANNQDFLGDTLKATSRLSNKLQYANATSATAKRSLENELARPTSIIRLKILIIVFIITTIGGFAADYAMQRTYMNQTAELNWVNLYAYRRLLALNLLTFQLFIYLNVANSLTSYTYSVVADMDAVLTLFRQSEFLIETSVHSSYVDKYINDVVYAPLVVKRIQANYVEYTESSTVNSALYEIMTKATIIIHSTASEAYSVNYINSFVPNSTSSTLTSFERGIYFYFANVLGELNNLMTQSGDTLHSVTLDNLDSNRWTLLWLHISLYACVTVFAILFVPLLLNIQKNKRKLLISFAELTIDEVMSLSINCKEYFKVYLTQVTTAEDDRERRAQRARENATEQDKKREMAKFSLKQDTIIKRIEHDSRVSLASETGAAGEDEATKSLIAKERSKVQEEIIRERKRQIENVAVHLGYVSLVVGAIFILIAGYYSKMLWSFLSGYTQIRESIESMLCIHRRASYLSSGLVYLVAYFKGMDRFDYTVTGSNPYEYLLGQITKNEELIKTFKTYPSNILKEFANLLNQYDSSEFCNLVTSIIDSSRVTLDWCHSTLGGILNEGLLNTLSYMVLLTKSSYYDTKLSSNVANMKLLMLSQNSIETTKVSMYVLSPAMASIEESVTIKLDDYFSSCQSYMIIDYLVMLLILVVAFFVLFIYFVQTIEREIFTERGILVILPRMIADRQQQQDGDNNSNTNKVQK